MILSRSVRGVATAVATAALLMVASASRADDTISDSHLKAARDAVAAIHATDLYDSILPSAADALKRELIQKNPDLTNDITSIVDNKAMELAARRADLEKEAAQAYARAMSEPDLRAIADFYKTPAGQTLLTKGPDVTREVGKAAQIWQNGIARDLAQEVAKELAAKANANAAQNPASPEGQQGTDQPASGN